MSLRHLVAAAPLLLSLSCSSADGVQSGVAGVISDVPQATGARVEVARINKTRSKLALSLPGEITGFRDALLASPTGGFVEAVLKREGDMVQKGQSIARINTAMMAAQQEMVQAQLDQAKAELARVEAMGDLASEQQRLGASTQVAVLEANLKASRLNTARSVVSAPFAGIVSSLGVEEGEVAGPGSPVARIIALDPVLVTVSVSDRDVGALTEGMPATVTVDALGGVFEGTVRRIDPAADLRTRTFMAEVEVANPEGQLKPGMIAMAEVSTAAGDDAIILPQDWLVTGLQGVGVYLEQEGVARWSPVRTGAVVHDQVVILDGVSEGDAVVMVGHRLLVDGDRLIVSRHGVCCTDGRATF